MNESGESRGLRISLKWLLIGVPFAGAGLGLLGRSFYRDPNEFRLALLLVTVVTPFILAVGTIIRLGWRSRRRALMAWGLLLLAAPFVGFGVRMFADHLYGAHGYGIVDNTTLIQQRLPNELTTPWVWQELERRVQAGSLSQAEVDQAIQTLTSHMNKNNSQGWNQPLHWEDEFIRLAAQKQLVSQHTLFDLCDAFYGSKPQLDHFSGMPGFRGDHRIGVEFGNHWGFGSQLPIALVWFPSKVLVDGKPAKFKTRMAHGSDWDGDFSGDFSPGHHDLTVELECAYVDSNSPAPWDTGCIERSKWPKKLHKTWTTTVSDKRPLMGMGMNMSLRRGMGSRVIGQRFPGQMPAGQPAVTPIKLSSRPADDPLAHQAIEVQRITIAPGRNNVSTASLVISVGDKLSIPISCDVTVKMAGKTFNFGTYRAGNIATRKFRMAAGNETQIGDVGEDVDVAEVTLAPNPKYAQEIPGVTEIWGKPLVFPNVPVERFDLNEEKP